MIRGSGCSKSKLGKAAGAEVAVQQSKKNGTPLWREAHLQVKMCMFGPLFEVEMWKNGTPTSQLFSTQLFR